jgi:tetratricopeptide (TPR) repeat protein
MTKKSIFSRINQSEEPEIDLLTQNRSNTKLIQDIELHLNRLTDSLQKGEFPVNIKKITQVFDAVVMIDRLPIDVPAFKFVDLYNDLPNILIGYAIDATLSDESYREPDVSQITFERLDRGTYWIFPTDRIGIQGAAWLVPNPLKDIKIDRNKSLNFSFDIDSSSNSDVLLLTKPALVKILPNSDRLIWKLTERGELRTGGAASQPAMANNGSIDPLALTKQIEHIVQARLRSAQNETLKQCQELIDRSIETLPDRVNPELDPTSQSIIQGAMVAKEYAKRANQFAQKGLEYAKSALSADDRSTNPAPSNVPAISQTPPVTAEDYFTRAKQKEQKNDLVGALLDYDRAIEIDSEYANAYFNKGMLQKNSSSGTDRTEAILSLRIAAKLYKQQGKLDIYQSLSETLQKLDGL